MVLAMGVGFSDGGESSKKGGLPEALVLKRLDGTEESLGKYKGKVLLVVNVASKCGFTKQYAGLEKLHQTYKDRGLVVMGFPCNQFGWQEPGDADDIQKFCSLNYGVSFPMFEKIDVNGDETHPLYQHLKARAKGMLNTEAIKWNFTKFLVSKDGQRVQRYGSKTKPMELTSTIESALAENQ